MSTRTPQKRTLKTRENLLSATRSLISENGFAGLRVEDVVSRAKVAKGTFFAHFDDKDRLMANLIGEELEKILTGISEDAAPASIAELVEKMMPLYTFMSQDRTVFDLTLRYSGALKVETTEAIALNFGHQIELMIRWLKPMQGKTVRSDIDADLLAEGVQAFAVQAMALKFCALHNTVAVEERLTSYLQAWLKIPS